ncbi:MAG: FAD-dependent oxidoreductase [Chloroflexota bacterium]
MTDSGRLAAVIAAQYAAEPGLAGQPISITLRSDIVTLSGEVATWSDVVNAGHIAASVAGVAGVVNDLAARDCPGTGRRALQPRLPVPTGQPPFTARQSQADIVIIGGGVIGCAVARELSRYQAGIAIVEREWDVACGASKGNNGMIHPGVDPEPGTLKAKLSVRGVELYDQAARELDFQLVRCGLLGVVTDPDELFVLDIVKARAEDNGVPGVELLYGLEAVRRIEPAVTDRAVGAFYAPTTGMVSPYKVTLAYAENAVMNGVALHLGTSVIGLAVRDGAVTGVITDRGTISCRLVINCAGIHSDDICAMADAREFTIHPRRGELLIFDRAAGDRYRCALSPFGLAYDPHTKGGGAMVTVDGNPEWGPTATEVPDRDDRRAERDGLERVLEKFQPLLPGFPARDSVIAYYSGLRAATYHEDFHIGPSRFVRGLYNVAGIQSPGLAAAPAIAEMVASEVRSLLSLGERADWQPLRREPPHLRDLGRAERDALIAADARYGRIVCRCETVSEGEIVAAIHGRVPALSVDAVKRRTRAGMGRCQGGFCLPRVTAILARELCVPATRITKKGPGSELFVAKAPSGRESA